MKIRKKAALVMALLMLLTLFSACRRSEVLDQVVYIQDAPEVDEDQTMKDPEDEGEKDEDFSNELDDVDTDRDTDADEGMEGESSEADKSADSEENPNANLDGHDQQAGNNDKSDGSTKQDDSRTPDDSRTGDNDKPSDGTGSGGSGETGSDTEPEPGDGGEGAESGGDANPDADPGAGGGGTATGGGVRQVTDASGNIIDVPENVNSVTACGVAAQMVEMLGGSGYLMGADSTFLNSSLAKAAFSDLGSVKSWWSSSGSISGSDFDSLLAAKPDVCFYMSGAGTFSDSQLTALKDAGIAAVALYSTKSVENLENTAIIIGQVLGGDAVSKAADYKSWAENAISSVSSKTSGYDLTSIYISSWDSDASYTIGDTRGVLSSTGSGLAVAFSRSKIQIMSSMMSAAHVTNESTRQNSHKKTNYVYVTPMFHDLSVSVSGSAATYYDGSGEYAVSKDLFVSRLVTDSSYYQLGSSNYPAIIVASEDVKSQIEASWFWQYHPVDESGYVNLGGQNFYCAIYGDYDIYVNPSGMLDWTLGSAESPLEAYWVAAKLCGTYSIDDVKSKTADFYKEFFGLSLSSSQLSSIFGE